jgi:hypothetical protein
VDLGDREARVLEAGDLGEEGVVAAGSLRPALDHVAGHDGAREAVPVLPLPAEVPGRGPDDERGVGHARAHHHVGPRRERLRDRPAPEIGVGGEHRAIEARERAAVFRVAERVAVPLERGQAREQVVALDVRDAGAEPQPRGQLPELRGEPGRVQAAGARHDADAPLERETEHVLHLPQERGRVARARVFLAGPPEQEHRQLGQVVAREDVDRATVEHLAGGAQPVAVEPRGVGDPDGRPGRRVVRTVRDPYHLYSIIVRHNVRLAVAEPEGDRTRAGCVSFLRKAYLESCAVVSVLQGEDRQPCRTADAARDHGRARPGHESRSGVRDSCRGAGAGRPRRAAFP